MKKHLFIFLVVGLNWPLAAQTLHYEVNPDNLHHHELYLSLTMEEAGADTVVLRMPVSSPGRYALHQFAKNVYEEKAFDRAGNPLPVIRTGPSEWQVPTDAGYAKFQYTLYGNRADGTYTGVDSRKIHLNMPATFLYAVGMEQTPVTLSFDLSNLPEWKAATQLISLNDTLFSAPNYSYFYDSPVLVGALSFRSWKVKDQVIEVAMLHEGTENELDSYSEWIKKIVTEEEKVFGELPAFDQGKYTFLCSYNPWVYQDGMEHRNSTVCTGNGTLRENASDFIGTIAHEFFHCWNVERIRPASLEPFDFSRANQSGELWLAEGFTSYYDDLTLCRSGIISPEEYIKGLSGLFTHVLTAPGRRIRNPIQMSNNAVFVDAGIAVDETNYQNNYLSYYSYGAVLGFALDLSLRSTYDRYSLDDYLRLLWQKYGRQEKPYTLQDLERTLTELTGEESFTRIFFDRYIYGSHLPDFKNLFSQFGIIMEHRFPQQVYFGPVILDQNFAVLTPVLRHTPLYEAGVEKGDLLISIAGHPISTGQDIVALSSQLKPGETYAITYLQMNQKKTGTFIARQDPAVAFSYLQDEEIDNEIRKKRKAWLNNSN